MAIQTFDGPNGLKLILDKSQVFPDDPGQGTPALVQRGEVTATYWCAVSERELEHDQLTDAEVDWLDSMESEVDKLFD